jgi:hypothetical protein
METAQLSFVVDCVVDGDVTEMTSPGVASPELEVVEILVV